MKPKEERSNFADIKRRCKKCVRCGREIIITSQDKISFCLECRGRMGSIKMSNYQEQMQQSYYVHDLLADIRRWVPFQ